MSKPSSLNALVLAIGAVCALLLWLWRDSLRRAENPATTIAADPRSSERASTLPPATPVLPTPEVRALTPEMRALLAALHDALAQTGIRAKEALLTFKDDAALQRFLARADAAGLTVVARADRLGAIRVRYDALNDLQNDLLQNSSDYSDVSANALIGIPRPPSLQDRAAVDHVPFGNETLAYLGADIDRASWGRGTTIAILDTGVALDPTFGHGRVRTLDIGLGAAPGNGRNDGHGTSVAALAAGLSPDAAGIAPAANVLSIRVTDASGMSDLFTVSEAIVAAVDAGARIVNISLGGYATGSILDSAIGYATQKGAVIVAAAGNDQAAQLAWPAADPRVISVGAIDRAEQQVSFSNSSDQLQLTAPGYGVQTAWLDGQRAYVDGTSASAPLVSGAIAAVMSQNSNLTAQQAAALLVGAASDGGAPGADDAFGHGILNVGWAMNRNNPAYVDTAVSSHHYDAANNQMQFVVQNRSGRSVSGMALEVGVGSMTTTQTVPSLAPGESHIARVPVSQSTLRTAGSVSFTTHLTNPFGVVDQVPANNRRSTVLTAPGKP